MDNHGAVQLSDNWTRNWQASIAVKITSLVLWALIGVVFAASVFVFKDVEKDLLVAYTDSADKLAYRVAEIISKEGSMAMQQIDSRQLPKSWVDLHKLCCGELAHTIGDVPRALDNLQPLLGGPSATPATTPPSLFTVEANELAGRIRGLELAGEPQWIASNFTGGVKRLPIRYRAA